MSNYQTNKEKVREQAISFQDSFPGGRAWSWGELADVQEYFIRQGKRYGLLTEFHENGIC